MATVKCADVLNTFSCLGESCEDTCCQGWSMQVDDATKQLYEQAAPELLDSIEPAQEASWIMRKNPATGFCVKFDNGLCGIHKEYGDRYLGNACHFYPRATRALGSHLIMTASLSCPEIARIALVEGHTSAMADKEIERLPCGLKDYLPAGMNEDDALAVHQVFLSACADESASAEQTFLRIASAARSLERIDHAGWPSMAGYYIEHADSLLPPPETNEVDPFNLLHALCGLIVASHKPMSERLRKTIETMEAALAVTLDWTNVQISADDRSINAYHQLPHALDKEDTLFVEQVLRRWLQMQMSLALFPFSGLGNTLSERVTVIGVRLAIIRLALFCNCSIRREESLPNVVISVVQSLSRFLDHLGDASFSMMIFTETGWTKEARMRGLLEK